ncbi:MAG: hypothetical protein WEA56_01790 [Balneolaceae bacterium]
MEASKNGIFFVTGIFFTLFAVMVTSCNSNVGNQNVREIKVDLIEAKTELPSKIRLFFKVDLTDDDQLIVQAPPDFEIFEDGSRISNLESQAQIRKELGDFMYSSILMLDLSGSILNNADLPRVKEAATSFIDRTMPGEGGKPLWYQGNGHILV